MCDPIPMPPSVVLVGFEDQDNLGLRYLSSTLRAAGVATRIVTVSTGPSVVLDAIRLAQPCVVGFSLIFQYLVPQFALLLSTLRREGVAAHFTMGGHYASFESAALLNAIPELDSVVRFEGEDTLLELVNRISARESWLQVQGITYRASDGEVMTNPTRPGRMNLDELPWPDRDDIDYESQYLPTASIIGGRGCPWVCSFCSIISFYEGNGTKGRRRRDPKNVADEIEYLHRDRGVRILLWQDDDFLAGGRVAVRWAHEIARECIDRGLHKTVRWKISCRSDETTLESLEPLVEAGLTHVYLGVESGDPDNLKNLNKKLEAEAHFRAGGVLRQLGLSFDFGFMLLEPWSTFSTVRNNIAFLRSFVGDGASVVGFCRMLPYVGTAVEARLMAEGRLAKKNLFADYSFLDPRLDLFYEWLVESFAERNFTSTGTNNILRLLLFESHLNLPERPINLLFQKRVKSMVAISNRIVLDTIESAVDYVETEGTVNLDDPVLASLKNHHSAEDKRLREDLVVLLETRPAALEMLNITR